jgi:hypothetical protein
MLGFSLSANQALQGTRCKRIAPELPPWQEDHMKETSSRITEPGKSPTSSRISAWIGRDGYKFWKRVTQLIERSYPETFSPDWLFGGKKHGWSLRYKKGKSFCTLIPEKNRFAIQIVFGAEEREKVEAIRDELSARTQEDYNRTKTYHDGKWLLLTVDADDVVADVERLLAVKRNPKNTK